MVVRVLIDQELELTSRAINLLTSGGKYGGGHMSGPAILPSRYVSHLLHYNGTLSQVAVPMISLQVLSSQVKTSVSMPHCTS